MKIYKLFVEYSKYLKEYNSEISLLLTLYEKIKPIINDFEYTDYFQLCKGYYNYYFYSPVVAYDILNNMYINDDFNQFITKPKCEKILQNKDIKAFVEQSKIVNTIIIKKISEIFSQNYKESSIENYYCNSILSPLSRARPFSPYTFSRSSSLWVWAS